MKSTTTPTPTLKLIQLPNGRLEMVLTGNYPMRDEDVAVILDDHEVEALKDFLNEPDATPTPRPEPEAQMNRDEQFMWRLGMTVIALLVLWFLGFTTWCLLHWPK